MKDAVSKLLTRITSMRRSDTVPQEPKLADLEKQVRQLTVVVRKLLQRHYHDFPLPPEHLRLNVGTTTTAANWWAQGMASSSRVLTVFGESPSGPILDWGCGSGRTLCWLQSYPAYRRRYHGCDVDKDAVAWLSELGHRVALCQDDPPLPYPDQCFSGIFSFSVLTHIPPDKHHEWYKELWRILQTGGRAYFTTMGPTKSSAIPSSKRAKFEANGHIFLSQRGHYKSAAIVTRAFTEQAIQGLFLLEDYKEKGYQDMDVYIMRRLARP